MKTAKTAKAAKTVKTTNKIVTVKKIEKKTVKNKTPDLGNNQCHLNHRSLKGLIIKNFYNHFQNSFW